MAALPGMRAWASRNEAIASWIRHHTDRTQAAHPATEHTPADLTDWWITRTIDQRIAALTDQELQLLATDLEDMPAGGNLLGAAGVVFIVLLILELVGVIDIFNKI